MHRRHLVLGFATAPLTCWPAFAEAQVWPDKLVRWVLSQPAGSGVDSVARLLSERLQKSWGQAIVIENRAGGQNTIGALTAARSPADGYTFYFATTAALITNPLLFKQLPYDPQKDFVPVAFVGRSPFALLVEATSPVKTIADLIARSKAKDGGFSLGNEGPRTFSGMIARLFNARTGAQANLVPYASVSVGVQDLIGGHVEAMVADVASVAPHVTHGRLRMLATTSSTRIAGWEQVPSLSETLAGFDMVGWFVVVAPTGTPAAAIGRFNKDLNDLLAVKEVAQRIATIGPLVEPGWPPAQVASFLRSESVRWTQLTKEIGVLPE